jgi:hypothetical protein
VFEFGVFGGEGVVESVHLLGGVLLNICFFHDEAILGDRGILLASLTRDLLRFEQSILQLILLIY